MKKYIVALVSCVVLEVILFHNVDAGTGKKSKGRTSSVDVAASSSAAAPSSALKKNWSAEEARVLTEYPTLHQELFFNEPDLPEESPFIQALRRREIPALEAAFSVIIEDESRADQLPYWGLLLFQTYWEEAVAPSALKRDLKKSLLSKFKAKLPREMQPILTQLSSGLQVASCLPKGQEFWEIDRAMGYIAEVESVFSPLLKELGPHVPGQRWVIPHTVAAVSLSALSLGSKLLSLDPKLVSEGNPVTGLRVEIVIPAIRQGFCLKAPVIAVCEGERAPEDTVEDMRTHFSRKTKELSLRTSAHLHFLHDHILAAIHIQDGATLSAPALISYGEAMRKGEVDLPLGIMEWEKGLTHITPELQESAAARYLWKAGWIGKLSVAENIESGFFRCNPLGGYSPFSDDTERLKSAYAIYKGVSQENPRGLMRRAQMLLKYPNLSLDKGIDPEDLLKRAVIEGEIEAAIFKILHLEQDVSPLSEEAVERKKIEQLRWLLVAFAMAPEGTFREKEFAWRLVTLFSQGLTSVPRSGEVFFRGVEYPDIRKILEDQEFIEIPRADILSFVQRLTRTSDKARWSFAVATLQNSLWAEQKGWGVNYIYHLCEKAYQLADEQAEDAYEIDEERMEREARDSALFLYVGGLIKKG